MSGRRFGTMTLSQIITSYAMLVIAATIDAASVNIFFAPFKIAPGGVTGVAVILNHLDARLPIGPDARWMAYRCTDCVLYIFVFAARRISQALYGGC
jgi:uncharacterized membrane-anchored protein YitT (DUF2179 family)